MLLFVLVYLSLFIVGLEAFQLMTLLYLSLASDNEVVAHRNVLEGDRFLKHSLSLPFLYFGLHAVSLSPK